MGSVMRKIYFKVAMFSRSCIIRNIHTFKINKFLNDENRNITIVFKLNILKIKGVHASKLERN